METQAPKVDTPALEFQPGTSVIYAMHGKCQVLGIEIRSLGDQSIRFYKLERKKPLSSRSNKAETAIWVPVANAKSQGLRLPMARPEAELAMKVLQSREYYFKTSEPWSSVLPKLEETILMEGGVGLAKVASYLYVLKKRQIVPTPEVTKFQDTIQKLLFRELSEALNETTKALEEKIVKGIRSKLIPDT